MIRFLINTAVFFASALVGIIAANAILDGFTVAGATGYVTVAIIFALIQAILSPLILKTVHNSASAFTGGVGIISTLVALIVTNLITDDLTIEGLSTWILAALIVWLFTAIATFLLAYLFVKKRVDERKS